MPSSRLRILHHHLGIPADYGQTRGLKAQREARRLVLAGRAADDGKEIRLTPHAAAAWRRMRAAAAQEGITLLPVSGFRSVARQTKIIRDKLAAGQSLEAILRLIAAPGFSEHHTGRALDIGSPTHLDLEEDFAATPEFAWLQRRATEFGFRLSYPRNSPTGIGYEPWHWLFGKA